MKKQGAIYKKTFCEYVENPKNYLYDNPPVNERNLSIAKEMNIFLK